MKEKKQPSFYLTLLPILAMIVLTSVGYIINEIQIEPIILIATVLAVLIAYKHGYTWDDIMDKITEKIAKALPAILILVIVGILIGTWMFGGTIPLMMYYGLKIINPEHLLITAFWVTSITSVCTETSWGSAGTIGVALMGVAAGLGVNNAAVAGAVISGAYFGDKLSPLSDTTNLAPIAAGSNLYDHIKHQLWTTLPSFILASIVYIIVGLKTGQAADTPEKVKIIMEFLNGNFDLNIFLLIPVILVLGGSILKKPTIPVMIISSLISIFNGIFFQHLSLKQGFTAMMNGFNISMLPGVNASEVIPDILKLLNRGGASSMLGTVLMAYFAFSFAASIDIIGGFESIIGRIVKANSGRFKLIATTLATCLTTVAVTCNGALSILLCGEMFHESFIKAKLDPKNLSRCLEDAITVTETLMPWTLAGAYMATTLGVPTLEYLPWAVLNYSGIIFALIWAYTGIGIAKLPETKE